MTVDRVEATWRGSGTDEYLRSTASTRRWALASRRMLTATASTPAVSPTRRGRMGRRRSRSAALATAATVITFAWMATAPAAAAPLATNTYSVTDTVALDPSGEAYGVGVDASVAKAYVSDLQKGTVSVVNTRTNEVMKQIRVGDYPHGVAVDESRHLAYVTSILTHTVAVIDTKKDVLIDTIALPTTHPYRLSVDPTTNKIYVTNNDGDRPTLTVIDGATRTTSAVIALQEPMSDVVVDPATRTVYGSSMGALGVVTVFDATTNTVSGTIPVGAYPTAIALDSETHELYVSNSLSDSISVIDGRTNAVSHVIPVGDSPQAVTVDAGRDAVYVAHTGSGGLAVVNASTKTVTNTAALGGFVTDVTVNPRTSAVYVSGILQTAAGSGNGLAVITCATAKGSPRCS